MQRAERERACSMQPIPPDDPCPTDDGTADGIKVNYHHDVDFEQELQLRRDFAHSWTGRATYSPPTQIEEF